MLDAMATPHQANVDRFSGFASRYDCSRPSPPAAMVDMLGQLARAPHPHRVVDLGCGTGLSTRVWAGRADEVVGVDPNEDMRRQAEEATDALPGGHGIRYQAGHSSDTGLPEGGADIVTCCQSLHWMEPESTFAEIGRILRAGGVFAACDADFPPVTLWEVEGAYRAFNARVDELEKELGVSDVVRRWHKTGHLKRLEASGRFRWTREILLHQVEMGNAERFVGLVTSFGSVPSLMKHGVSEEQLGLPALRAIAHEVLGDAMRPWYFSFRLRVGVK